MADVTCSRRRRIGAVLLAVALEPFLAAQSDWPSYGHDAGASRYSPLSQINTRNVASLRSVWKYDSDEIGASFETTPIVAGDTMYISTPRERVVALDAETGHEIWSFDTKVKRPTTHRGVSYWPGDGQTPARVLAATTDGRLFAIDAKSGKPIAAFGDDGVVNLRAGVADNFPLAAYGISSPPAIFKNLLIVGPRTQESPAKGPAGDIRAFDVRTGKLVWSFHSLPRPGEPGYDTWGPDFWKDGSGPSAWAAITVDPERQMVFVPVGNPAGGGDPAGRKGTNLYSDSVVALDALTGKLRWHYQMVHHDMWDYDVPAPPALIEISRGGKKTPAIAQMTKQGFLYILDRMTGQPIFGAEERPVAKGNNPGDESWPTQPFPLKPPPLARNSMSADDISRITPESAEFCGNLVATHRTGGPFMPRGSDPAINFPSSIGGGNWGGVSFDPPLGYIFVNTMDLGSLSNGRGGGRANQKAPSSAPAAAAADANTPAAFGETGGVRFVDQDHYPCNKPPWGQLIAVNVNTGDIAWRSVLGGYKELEDKGIKDTGAANLGGSIATAGGLVFIGATNDLRFRAFDARTGKQLWTADLDGDAFAPPIAFQGRSGKQYVVVTSGGPGYLNGVGPRRSDVPGKLTAFALP